MGCLNFFGKKEDAKAGFVKDYEALFEKSIPRLRPISQLNFVVLDTETTGLQPKSDYILSFGAVKVRGYKISVNSAIEIYLNAPLQNRDRKSVV
jgi:DNA polymerase-3 subunit epsilon